MPFSFVRLGAGDAGTGRYEVVHEDGEPDGHEGTALIAPVEVGADDEERFLAAWHAVRDVLAGQRGYLGARLHRAIGEDADFRFVALVRWSSPLMVQRAARTPAFAALPALPFPAYPALYLVAPASSG